MGGGILQIADKLHRKPGIESAHNNRAPERQVRDIRVIAVAVLQVGRGGDRIEPDRSRRT